jgi:hypothetical protein
MRRYPAFHLTAVAMLALLAGACTGPGGGGTPSDPPGTAAMRGLDRISGTNNSGAYPMQSDGMPGNPRGTELGRATDRALDTNDTGAGRRR